MKECKKCGIRKPLDLFYKHPSCKYGRMTECKECKKEYTHSMRHPETERKPLVQHKMSGTKEHRIWRHIINRCRNKNDPKYPLYGGVGIDVCDKWAESFSTFYADMGSIGEFTSIDRLDNSKGYFKENCRWANDFMQANNKRSNVIACVEEKRMTVAQWARYIGVSSKSIYTRIARGESPDQAVTHFFNKREIYAI